MEVLLSEQFEQAYERLTKAEKRSVGKALALLGDNPRHPGLHVKKMGGRSDTWEAPPSKRSRMTFIIAGQNVIMRNVGNTTKS